jgi:glycosyltransferase involved in cell wall biosynthesis
MAAELLRLVGTESVRFQWVGVSDSVEDQFYASIAEKMGIGTYVEFVPATADPGSFYRNFDVFAMTSWEDPCPLVVFENMALGVPVVCFAGGGGAPEQVGETGVVVVDFSPLKMANCIAGLVRNHSELTRLGVAAAARYRDFYAIDVVGPKLLAELANLCSL